MYKCFKSFMFCIHVCLFLVYILHLLIIVSIVSFQSFFFKFIFFFSDWFRFDARGLLLGADRKAGPLAGLPAAPIPPLPILIATGSVRTTKFCASSPEKALPALLYAPARSASFNFAPNLPTASAKVRVRGGLDPSLCLICKAPVK